MCDVYVILITKGKMKRNFFFYFIRVFTDHIALVSNVESYHLFVFGVLRLSISRQNIFDTDVTAN